MKIKFKYLTLLIINILLLNLIGCCSSSSGGNNLTEELEKSITTSVKADGSIDYKWEGFRISALPDTFEPGTKITIGLKTIEKGIDTIGLNKQDISLLSPVYSIRLDPAQEILNEFATVTIDIADLSKASDSKIYFAVNRNITNLVTSENDDSLSTSMRSSTLLKDKQLPIISTFNYISLATINNEFIKEAPTITIDNPNKRAVNQTYASNITLFTKLSTVKDILEEFKNGAKFQLNLKTDGASLDKLSNVDTPIFLRKAVEGSKLLQGYIDLTNKQIEKLENNTLRYSAYCDSLGKKQNEIPRRIVFESVFTNKRNLPVASREHVVFFKPSQRPYVTNVWPLADSYVTNQEQLENIVVNFSEPMNKSSVEKAASVKIGNQLFSADDSSHKLLFKWENNNKQLSISGNYGLTTATETVTVSIAKTAVSDSSGEQISNRPNADKAKDIIWNFKYSPNDFYVKMTTPLPGTNNFPISDEENKAFGPRITLTFNETFYPNLTEGSITIYNGDTKIEFELDEKEFYKRQIITFRPKKRLEYGKEYTVVVSKNLQNLKQNKKLLEDYKATFITKGPFASGTGIFNDPYLISNQEELSNVGLPAIVNSENYFKLANNITIKPVTDDSEALWSPIGTNKTPFKGYFDGNNKKIINLIINKFKNSQVGLFGCIAGSEIKNLKLETPTVLGHSQVGGLVGYCVNSTLNNIEIINPTIKTAEKAAGCITGESIATTIKNCNVNSNTELFGVGNEIGGIIGFARLNTIITNSHVCLEGVSIDGTDYIGGIAGHVKNSKIVSSTFSGNINAHNFVGGIAGQTENSKLMNCYSDEGIIKSANSTGGISGYISESSIIEQSASTLAEECSGDNAGGIAGLVENSEITDSYTGETYIETKTKNCGGIAGYTKNSKINCAVSRSNVSASDYAGGIVGKSVDSTIQNVGALLETINSSYDENVNRIIGFGENNTLIQTYSLSNTKFYYNKSISESYIHKPTSFDGTIKNSESEISSNLILNENIWKKSPNIILKRN